MHTGKIKFFKKDKGYGFIIPDHEEQDVFFHKTALRGLEEITQHTRVNYEVEEGRKGIQAKVIEVI